MNKDGDDNSKQTLLKLVQLKDNIGEASWYIYTAILITSFVYYKLADVGCELSVSQIKDNHDKYIQEQEANDKKQATANSAQAVLS
jgi:tmRNA-binding protein